MRASFLAVQIYMCGYHNNQKRISDVSCKDLLVATGMWAKYVDKLIPATLGNVFMSHPDFRADIARMVSKEPPVAVSAFGNIALCFVQSVGKLRRAKQQFDTNLIMAGDNSPGSLMAAAAASELNHVQYLTNIALDVDLYAQASQKGGEETEPREKHWTN